MKVNREEKAYCGKMAASSKLKLGQDPSNFLSCSDLVEVGPGQYDEIPEITGLIFKDG